MMKLNILMENSQFSVFLTYIERVYFQSVSFFFNLSVGTEIFKRKNKLMRFLKFVLISSHRHFYAKNLTIGK